MTQEEPLGGRFESQTNDDSSAPANRSGSDSASGNEAADQAGSAGLSSDTYYRPDQQSAGAANPWAGHGSQQPYQGQPGQQPYSGQPYDGQQSYSGQPYDGQQPYQGQPYQGQPYQGQQQPYQGQPGQQPYQGQPYQGQPYQQYPGAGYQEPPYPVPSGAPLSDSDAQLWSVLSHVGMIVTGFVGPLIIWAVVKDRNPVVRQNAAAATNFGFLMAIAYIVGSILSVVVIGVFILMAAGIVAVIFGIIGAVRANSGAVYPYPFNVKWIK